MADTTTRTMKAWRKHHDSTQAMYDKVPIPHCPATGYLLKVLAAGVCHSDYALLQRLQKAPRFQDQYILGHEGCGEIVEMGDEVGSSEFKLGDRVVVNIAPGCAEADCRPCCEDLTQLCQRARQYGLGTDGSLAPYVAVDNARSLVRLPEGISPAIGAVSSDAIMTAYHGMVRRAAVKKGELVFIFGLGGLGFNAIQIARAKGARVLVSDVRQSALDAAVEFGVAQEDVVPAGTKVPEWVKDNGLENQIDVVADFAGMEQTFSDAQQIVRFGGRIISIGLLAPQLAVNNVLCTRKHISILFSFAGVKQDVVEGLEMVAEGKLRPQVETRPLEDFPMVLDDLHHGKIKSRMALVPSVYD